LSEPVGAGGHGETAQGGQAGQAGNERGPKAAGRLEAGVCTGLGDVPVQKRWQLPDGQHDGG
jgi:hypothetical protein